MAIELAPLVTEFHDASVWGEELPHPKGKGKEIAAPDIVLSTPEASQSTEIKREVDWTKYEPPAGLLDTTGVDSEDIKQIIQESVDRIKARIAEEEAARQVMIEAEKLRLEAENEKEVITEASEPADSEKKEDIEENPSTPRHAAAIQPAIFAGVKFAIGPYGLLRPAPPPKSKVRSFMALLRRLNNTEKGESSAQGAARNKQNSPDTRSAARLVKNTATSNSPRSSMVEEIVECVSCLEDFEPKATIKVPCHNYCEDCFHRLIRTACENEQRWPPKCCLNEIPEETIMANTDKEIQKEYHQKAEEWSIPVGDRLYCPDQHCSLFIQPDKINRDSNTVSCSAGHEMCVLCRGTPHPNDASCPQDRELQRTEELAEEEGWKRCPGCRAFVEHREACQHMTCRCGAQFCYVCVAPWRTCRCTMEQLQEIKSAAQRRRRRRAAREDAEAAEAAEAIRLVEEFEREEARKAELLHAERERLEQERRRHELAERLRREGARRRAVATRHRGLRADLAALHDRQRVLVVCAQSRATDDRAEEAAAAARARHNAYDARRLEHRRGAEAWMGDLEARLRDEHAARVREERRIEKEYEARLVAYWARAKGGEYDRGGEPESEGGRGGNHGDDEYEEGAEEQTTATSSVKIPEVEAAMLDLRRKMDRGFRAWGLWVREVHARHQLHVQEQMAAQLIEFEEEERRLTAAQAEAQAIAEQEKFAEMRWVDIVIRERGDMLREKEAHEMEGDGDGDGENLDVLLAESEQLGVELDFGIDDEASPWE